MKTCKGCEERTEGCQDRCPSFIALKMAKDEIFERTRNEKRKDDQMFKSMCRSKKVRRVHKNDIY